MFKRIVRFWVTKESASQVLWFATRCFIASLCPRGYYPGCRFYSATNNIFMIVLTPTLKLSDILVKEEVRRERLPPKCITNVS